ncbi:MAG: peptidoglycan DD-metalloendopeptidase family protein [Magnetococcales bacterium]|nr:peptidoglycan DD-metalloendopeptidase family protein [Magnetococcales bacterium]
MKWVGLLLAVGLGWLGVTSTDAAVKPSLAQLEAKRQQMQEVVQKLKQEEQRLQQSEQQEQSTLGELEQFDQRLQQGKQHHEELSQQVVKTEEELARLAPEIDSRQEDLHQEQERLAVHLRLMYALQGRGVVKLVLSQDHPEKIRQVIHYFNYLLRERHRQFSRFRRSVDELKQAVQRRKEAADRSRTLMANLQLEANEIEQRRKERNAFLASLRSEKKVVSRHVQELQKARENSLVFIERLEKSLEKSGVAVATPPQDSEGEIMQYRGLFARPVAGNGSDRSPGIFFPVADATPVRAVFRGQVVYADWFRGYGLMVILAHGDRVYSLYGHNSKILVETGDWVEAGEPIADSGDTGSLEGEAGLYFEIRRNGRVENARQWLQPAG